MKTQVKLDLSGMSPVEKIAFANGVANAMIANDSLFDAPPIAGADLIDFATSVSEAITAAEAAKSTYHSLILAQRDMENQLDGYLRQTGSYVQNVSGGDAAIIQLAGLPVRRISARVGKLEAPTGLTAEVHTTAGMVTVRWEPNPNAKTYHLQYSTDMAFPEGASETRLACKGKAILFPLRPATKYWMRVAAVNAAGPSEWSSVVGVVTQ